LPPSLAPEPGPGEDPDEAPPSDDGGTTGKPGTGGDGEPGLSGGAGKPSAEEVEVDPGTPNPGEAPSGNGSIPGSPGTPNSPGNVTPDPNTTLQEPGGGQGGTRELRANRGPDADGGGSFGIGGGGVAGPGTSGTGTGAVLGAEALTSALTPASLPSDTSSGDGGGGNSEGARGTGSQGNDQDAGGEGASQEIAPFGAPVFGDLAGFVSFVPTWMKIALVTLAALVLLLGLGYLLSALRNRRLTRQRGELLQEVGLLQTALLPPVPERVGALRTSVAYRPADGPGAGGDFYDVLPLAGGRVGFILGDVSGHGRGALARTAFMRYTLRAYLEAGLEPRVALQVAGRVIDDNLGGDFATVLLAVHDPDTGSLTYATAGHPSPIVVGPQAHEPVTAGSSPPIGVGVRTGLRQTTVPLVPGSVASLFTDGLMEARVDGGMLGRESLEELLSELGPEATAAGLIESVRSKARVLSDDIAAVVIQPTGGATAGLFRTEQLELTARELSGPLAARFLEACGVEAPDIETTLNDARSLAERFGGVILHVVFGNRLRVEVLPRNVESIEAASRRASATT
jgi:serine phosphatase RsbU (regulator of sigma subunit)